MLVDHGWEKVPQHPPEHHLGRGPPAALNRGDTELHDGPHELVGVQAAPRPYDVPKQLLVHLHNELSSAVGVRNVYGAKAVAFNPFFQIFWYVEDIICGPPYVVISTGTLKSVKYCLVLFTKDLASNSPCPAE